MLRFAFKQSKLCSSSIASVGKTKINFDQVNKSVLTNQSRPFAYDANKISLDPKETSRVYPWVSEEAETLIAKVSLKHVYQSKYEYDR